MKRIVIALVTILLCQLASASANWELVREAKQRDDVKTWERPVPGNSLNAFKGIIEVPHSMLTVLAVLGDIENFPEWVYQCDGAHLLPEFGHDVAYVHIAGIWPVSARDIVTRTTLSQDPKTLTITMHSVAEPNLLPKQKGTVRLPALDNSFILEPMADGWTRVTFETFVDPGGFIPSWLANIVATRAPRDTLEGMYKMMEDEKYHIQSADQLPEQFEGTEKMAFPDSTPIR